MDDIKIEIADMNDINEISILENNYPFEQYSEKQIKEFFAYDYYIILKCKKDDDIIGYLCATILYEECNLLKIIVNDECRRRGVGKKLLNALIEICKDKNVCDIYLEVRENNYIAISFYESMGFQLENVRREYYNGIDAKIYRLNI